MTAAVAGLRKVNSFYDAARLSDIPWRLNFPEESARHIVNSLLYQRIAEELHAQHEAVTTHKTEQLQTQHIAVTADVNVEQLKEVLKQLRPQEPSPPSRDLSETAVQQMEAANQRHVAELQRAMEEKSAEDKRHLIATMSALELSHQTHKNDMQQVLDHIVAKTGTPSQTIHHHVDASTHNVDAQTNHLHQHHTSII